MSYRCETFSEKHQAALTSYFELAREQAPNNADWKRLRMDQYNGTDGDLFLILDERNKIWAMSSVILTQEAGGPTVKVYGRFHVVPGCPHSIIDGMLEPASFKWIEDRNIQNVYLTINQGHLRTLEWVARRCGINRGRNRSNSYGHSYGHNIRSGWVAHPRLIWEREVWQYCIYYSQNSQFFLDRPSKELDAEGDSIFRKNLPYGGAPPSVILTSVFVATPVTKFNRPAN